MHHLYKIRDGSSVRPSEACPERAWSGPTQGESAGGSVCSVGKDTGAVCVRGASDKVSTACPRSPACHAGLRHPVRVPHGLALGTARAASPAQTGPGHVELPPLWPGGGLGCSSPRLLCGLLLPTGFLAHRPQSPPLGISTPHPCQVISLLVEATHLPPAGKCPPGP